MKQNSTAFSNSSKVVIGYMINPDIVLDTDLDNTLIKKLTECGAEVIKFEIDDIEFSITPNKIEIYINNSHTHLDGFLSFGYMHQLHYEAFMYITSTFEAIGVTTLHSVNAEQVLANKYLQSLQFSKNKVPIPDTQIAFEMKGFKSLAKNFHSNGYS